MTAHSICFWKSYLFTPHYWGFEKDWDNLLFATWEECLLKEDCKQDFSRNHGNSFKIYKNSIQIGSILTPSIYLHVMEIQSYLAVMVVNIFVIIITHITCLLKKLREGRKISIYRVCYINLFFFTISGSFHLVLWTQVTKWCSFLIPIQLCFHLHLLYC